MNIQTVKISGNGYLINEKVYVPSDSKNKDYQEIQEWIANGGVMSPEFTSAEIKQNVILKIKSEAGRRIDTTYPEYKQRNLTGAVSRIQNKEILALKAGGDNYTPTAEELLELSAANDCELFIKAIRAKSNELEASLDDMTQEELEAFDPSDNLNWE